MKEMNESLGNENRSHDKPQEILVSENKAKELPVTDENMVLLNLISHRAATVRLEYMGRLVPSNFAIIRVNEALYAPYLEWYLNESPESRKYLSEATQGTTVAALSIQKLRALPMVVPSLKEQKIIGDVYRSLLNKKRLLMQRIYLEEKSINQQLWSYLQEGLR
ncbi:restriction endonuclease S subunit [Paenibacillus baekrokdamisoli]|nr:restriction endonuclease subunit S [Paenibacillus baekrokdamisoli]MBB3067841.1 restriction endonuclease S subunit [Paenibacillus baekrokdamisoli]